MCYLCRSSYKNPDCTGWSQTCGTRQAFEMLTKCDYHTHIYAVSQTKDGQYLCHACAFMKRVKGFDPERLSSQTEKDWDEAWKEIRLLGCGLR